METRINTEDLQKALYRAQGIVNRKATMPVLANVLIEAKANVLVIAASDLEIGLRDEYEADVIQPGRLTVPAKPFLDIARSLPSGEVLLSTKPNNRIEISSANVRFKLVGAAADDFPSLPQVDEVEMVDIPGALLSEMIEKTHFAVSFDETRYHLNGVFVERTDNLVRMVATDGHRLALIEKHLDGTLHLDRGVIIPRKGLTEMRRLLSEKPGTVSLGFTGSNAVFRIESLVLVMRLVDGQFPDYEKVIPAKGESPIIIDREALLDALKRVRLVSGDKAPPVRIKARQGSLVVSSENPDLGEASEEIELNYDGPELNVGFNANYIIDVLSVLSNKEIELDVSGELAPGIIKPSDSDDYRAVIMPMRT